MGFYGTVGGCVCMLNWCEVSKQWRAIMTRVHWSFIILDAHNGRRPAVSDKQYAWLTQFMLKRVKYREKNRTDRLLPPWATVTRDPSGSSTKLMMRFWSWLAWGPNYHSTPLTAACWLWDATRYKWEPPAALLVAHRMDMAVKVCQYEVLRDFKLSINDLIGLNHEEVPNRHGRGAITKLYSLYAVRKLARRKHQNRFASVTKLRAMAKAAGLQWQGAIKSVREQLWAYICADELGLEANEPVLS